LAKCSLGNGCSVLLWHDVWTDQILNAKWPHLFSLAKQHHITVKQALEVPDEAELFHLPLSAEAYSEFLEFQILRTSVSLQNQHDSWLVFDNNSKFNVSKAYKHLMGEHETIPAIKWLWKTRCQQKTQSFLLVTLT
jgi:hypothetical protein